MNKITFKNPFEVNENDTLGSAVMKGLAEGYIKGTLAAGAGLGVLAIIGHVVSKKEKSSKKKKEEAEKVISDEERFDEIMEEHGFVKEEVTE